MADFLCPYDAWEPWPVTVHQGQGPEPVLVDEAAVDKLPLSGPVGFTADLSKRPGKKPKRKRR